MRFLVCGGAGYVGSHALLRLLQLGHEAVVFDNLSTGHRQAVGDCELVVGDLLDAGAIRKVLAERRFDAVMHFGASSLVEDSRRIPVSYYINNVAGTLNLLDAMVSVEVSKLVFSSSAAVFGEPIAARIDEAHPCSPINPYGQSKLFVERILQDAAVAYGLRSVALRYFNAAGADPSGTIGESHQPETHLIPNALRSGVGGVRLRIHGNDYPTEDGTCVRDYVHVNDLADAHLLAAEYLAGNAGAHVFNLGNDDGFSVMQIVRAASKVTGRQIAYDSAPRREGDPAMLVANSQRARKLLGWRPQWTNVEDIIASAWRWHSASRY